MAFRNTLTLFGVDNKLSALKEGINLMLFELGSVLMFMITAMVIVGFTLLLAKAVRADNPNPEKLSGYECGEDPIGSSWVQSDMLEER